MPKLNNQEIKMLMFGIGLGMGYASDVTAFSGALMLFMMFVIYMINEITD